MRKTKISLIIILALIGIVTYTFLYLSEGHKYSVETPSSVIDIDRSEWKTLENPTDFAENFQRRKKRDKELFEQVVTVYHSDLNETDLINVPEIEEGVWLELFLLHPGSVTAQMSMEKSDYWVHSRQTLLVENFPSLDNLNPENSIEEYTQFTLFLKEELENTIYILEDKF